MYDEHGARIRPWQESSTRGRVGLDSELFEDARPIPTEVVELLKATAPPIVKTTGLSKATRLTNTWEEHFNMWRAMLGRPIVVGDLSDQTRRAFHMDTLKPATVITRYVVLRAAKLRLAEAEREMRASQHKRVAKEAFYVPAGVR